MKYYCVTGGSGFIGQHLVNRLLTDGHEVKVVDLKVGSDIRNLTPEDFRGVEYVFHLAALPRVPYSIEFPRETNDTNISGTLNVLWCAKEAGVKRVIYSSSSSVYGNQKVLPLRETLAPKPLSPYGIQKLVGEMYCRVFYELYGLETVSLRYFNVFGEGSPADNPYSAVIAKFLDAVERKEPLQVNGGDQTRDFTYVEDVVEANLLAAVSPRAGKGEAINIGGGKNYSIKEIAEALSDNIEYFPPRAGECQHTLAKIRKAGKILGWSPKVSLMDWLRVFRSRQQG